MRTVPSKSPDAASGSFESIIYKCFGEGCCLQSLDMSQLWQLLRLSFFGIPCEALSWHLPKWTLLGWVHNHQVVLGDQSNPALSICFCPQT